MEILSHFLTALNEIVHSEEVHESGHVMLREKPLVTEFERDLEIVHGVAKGHRVLQHNIYEIGKHVSC